MGVMIKDIARILGVRWRVRFIASSPNHFHFGPKEHNFATRTRDNKQHLTTADSLQVLSMGDTLANVHETIQDSLDVVSVAGSMNIPNTHLCVARIGAFIYHGTITGTGEFGTSDHPNICNPRRLSNITRFLVTSEYLRVQQ
jgi:hypothetical protein